MYTDALCHLEDPRAGDVARALDAAAAADVHALLWAEADPLRARPPPAPPAGLRVHIARGLHPGFIQGDGRAQLDAVVRALDAGARAVGEIGLDAREGLAPLSVQLHCVAAQLDEAGARDLPVVLHVVRAHEQMLALLHDRAPVRGLVHGFRKSEALARRYLDAGLAVSFGLPLAHPGADRLRQVAAALPKNRVLTETDTPEPHAGHASSPAQVRAVTDALAAARGTPVDETAAAVAAAFDAVLGV